jgi:glycerol-3-phosphate dehydrogenase subunit C
MKADHYETGRKYAGKLVREVGEADNDVVVTDCPLSALRITKENEVEALHPVQALAKAYGLKT